MNSRVCLRESREEAGDIIFFLMHDLNYSICVFPIFLSELLGKFEEEVTIDREGLR